MGAWEGPAARPVGACCAGAPRRRHVGDRVAAPSPGGAE
eukprot:gene30167-15897_t